MRYNRGRLLHVFCKNISSGSEINSMTQIRVGPLVRATSTNSATIWVEMTSPCSIIFNAISSDTPDTIEASSTSIHTSTIGERYYALLQLHGLQPATWYTYWLEVVTYTEAGKVTKRIGESLLCCFRTMNKAPEQDSSSPNFETLRLAYGSCRKFVDPEVDAFSAFGRWLRDHAEQRETTWPHLLLLIGDQIYADQPSNALIEQHPQLSNGATTFEDFAQLYEYAWTQDSDARQVLACLPTYMMFDDHEITNDWMNTPQWCASMLEQGREQILVDGMVAYWIYQGWGNLIQREDERYPLLQIMQEAEHSDEDILERLRTHIRREVHCESSGHWHYDIPTVPPIFVVNARSERTTVFTKEENAIYGPTRILSKAQMQELASWMQLHDSSVSLLVSSVPVILPPLIGLAEYIMGVRLWWFGLRWLGRTIGKIQQHIAIRTSFDHWPLFSETWRELIRILAKRKHDIIVLSGDVHFSYAMEARRVFSKPEQARLVQLVSTPLHNELGRQSEQMVTGQARVTRTTYGGVHTQILQLHTPDNTRRTRYDMLFRNTIAYVTLIPDAVKTYKVQQDYLVVEDDQIQVIGHTVMVEH